MALVQLTDLVFGESWDSYIAERSVERSAVFQSGIVVDDPAVEAKALGEGFLFNLPHWKPIGNDEPNAGTDNPADVAVPKKATTGAEKARKLIYNQHWSAADLTLEAVGEDPMEYIGDQVADYWAIQFQRILIRESLGVLADNVANDGGDMLLSVATDAVGAPTAAELISGDVAIEAFQTMGDAKTGLGAIAMHSRVHANLQKLGLLVEGYDLESGLPFETFIGKRVIIDDSMPVTVGTNRTTYTSIVFGPGVFRFGNGRAKVPTAVTREELQGNGEGVELLHSRRHFILHPRGFAWTEASVAGDAPTYTELATAANWNRVFNRKNIPMAFIQTNG